MVDEGPESIKVGNNKEGEDEMTVVVPPPKGTKLSGEPGKDEQGDVSMDSMEHVENASSEAQIDPKVKAVTGQSILSFCDLTSNPISMNLLCKLTMFQTSKPTLPR